MAGMIFWLDNTLSGSLVWLFIFFIGLEYAVISSLSMMAEIVPQARASVIAIYYATVSIGFSLGPAVTPLLYRHGFALNSLACVFLFGGALFFLVKIRLAENLHPHKSSA
jgi:MFS family permease